jgi:hypothetical protein
MFGIEDVQAMIEEKIFLQSIQVVAAWRECDKAFGSVGLTFLARGG